MQQIKYQHWNTLDVQNQVLVNWSAVAVARI